MKCATHPDRSALGYCGRCGKALCKECLVRLSTGNYCDTCANAPARAARSARGLPWWALALIIVAAVIVIRAIIH
jgi:hypothetical protein